MRSLLILVAAAISSTALAAPSPDADAPKKVREKKICRVAEGLTGTRLPPRTCKTAAEWAADEEREVQSRRTYEDR